MEIMCTVAILGILVAVVAPSLSSSQSHARASECSSNLRLIQSAKAAYLMARLGKTRVATEDPQEYELFVNYFGTAGIPKGCPCADNPEDPKYSYKNLEDLYTDTVCPNNCPEGGSRANYPFEPDIGGPNYYRNGYHDLYRREK